MTLSLCARANCSTTGASTRHADQLGAHIHKSTALSDGANDVRLIVVPFTTSTTDTDGKSEGLLGTVAVAAVVVGPPP